MKQRIKVAVVGVGNCAKSLLEGVAYYTQHPDEKTGLMNPLIGKYHLSDIDFVAAFDIDSRKVGKKLHEAIYAEPNHTMKISSPLEYDINVQRGPTLDSIVKEMKQYFIQESAEPVVNITDILKKSGAEIVINYLPTGSKDATYAYAEAALQAGCSFINCMPTPIAKDSFWRNRFESKGLVLIGDDIKSQLGATILNRFLLTLLKMRGIKLTLSEQVNYGGNADHFNLQYRPHSKEESKEAALNSVLDENDAKPTARMVYTEKNFDHKRAVLKIEGRIFGNIPTSMNVILEDEDSPNSAGIVVDVIRIVKLLTESDTINADHVDYVAAWLMKSPPVQISDNKAISLYKKVLQFYIKEKKTNKKEMVLID